MKEHIDIVIEHLTALKPHELDLDKVKEQVKQAKLEQQSLQVGLEKLRKTIVEERNARAAENNRAKKEHDDMVQGRTGAIADMSTAIEEARAELVQVQNDIAKYQKILDDISKAANKALKSSA
jgi:chromosome segregation ATPase